jgi:hypothetical protein
MIKLANFDQRLYILFEFQFFKFQENQSMSETLKACKKLFQRRVPRKYLSQACLVIIMPTKKAIKNLSSSKIKEQKNKFQQEQEKKNSLLVCVISNRFFCCLFWIIILLLFHFYWFLFKGLLLC